MIRAACLAVLLGAAGAWAAPPNVVLIISDDHGWTDYGFAGHPHIRTPHIDKLAAESLVYTRGYVPSSLCRPSLASIMTGLYPHQHGITGNDPDGSARDAANRARMVDLFQKSKTVAGLLAEKGYLSLQTGKWWEGQCTCGGFTSCMTHGDVARGGRHGDEGLQIGRQTMQPIHDFLDRTGGKPFFLWYAPMMPHTPHNPPERLLARYKEHPAAIAKYYAMCEWFDETVGELLAQLDRRGLADNTVVLYLADNGWVQPETMRALFDTKAKLSPYDAGLRTPIMVRWPGKVRPARDEKTLASSIDLAPTVLAAAGIPKEPAMPGINLADRSAMAKREAIYGSLFAHTAVDVAAPSRNLKYRWVIRGRWKLVVPHSPNSAVPIWEGRPERDWFTEPQLFDIVADPKETANLAGRHPDVVRRLRQELDGWWEVPER